MDRKGADKPGRLWPKAGNSSEMRINVRGCITQNSVSEVAQ